MGELEASNCSCVYSAFTAVLMEVDDSEYLHQQQPAQLWLQNCGLSPELLSLSQGLYQSVTEYHREFTHTCIKSIFCSQFTEVNCCIWHDSFMTSMFGILMASYALAKLIFREVLRKRQQIQKILFLRHLVTLPVKGDLI